MAGAIALQSLFTGVEGDYTKETGADLDRAQMQIAAPSQVPFADMSVVAARVTSTKGVTRATTLGGTSLGDRARNARTT